MKFNFDWNYIASGAPYITISEFGLAFNSPAISMLGNPKKVIMGFDLENMTIGIKEYENEADIKAYDFSERVRNGWIRIGCKDFVKNLANLSGLSFSPAIKYLAQYDSEERVLYITINNPESEE